MFSQHFGRDFQAIVETQEPFALVRFHDGEHAILERLPYSAASKWTVAAGNVWLREELAQVLKPKMDRFCIGVSPPCCAPTAAQYFRRHLGVHRSFVTYATIFSNRNYRRVPKLRARFKDAVIVASGNADIKVPSNGVRQKWDVDAVVDKLLKVDKPILVAAGPCANLIIYRYWKRQDKDKRQYIIDVGAALDVQIHGKTTRHYHSTQSRALYHECSWDKWAPFSPVADGAREQAARVARQEYLFKTLQGTPVSGLKRGRSKRAYASRPSRVSIMSGRRLKQTVKKGYGKK